MTKKEKIEEAYGKFYDAYNIDDNGWFDNTAYRFTELELQELESCDYKSSYVFRPKYLSGIEDNNGWIKIKSEADLPKSDVDCFLCSHDGYIYCDRYLVNTKNFLRSHYKYITHFQPIQKPKPPIY